MTLSAPQFNPVSIIMSINNNVTKTRFSFCVQAGNSHDLGVISTTLCRRLSLKRGTGNRGMGTGNGEALKAGIFKMGNLQNGESSKRGIFKSGHL